MLLIEKSSPAGVTRDRSAGVTTCFRSASLSASTVALCRAAGSEIALMRSQSPLERLSLTESSQLLYSWTACRFRLAAAVS